MKQILLLTLVYYFALYFSFVFIFLKCLFLWKKIGYLKGKYKIFWFSFYIKPQQNIHKLLLNIYNLFSFHSNVKSQILFLWSIPGPFLLPFAVIALVQTLTHCVYFSLVLTSHQVSQSSITYCFPGYFLHFST